VNFRILKGGNMWCDYIFSTFLFANSEFLCAKYVVALHIFDFLNSESRKVYIVGFLLARDV
jgi:hypothetical protein